MPRGLHTARYRRAFLLLVAWGVARPVLPGPAQEARSDAAVIEQVAVSGGNSIQGVEHGVIYQAGTGNPGRGMKPVSGALDSRLEMTITVKRPPHGRAAADCSVRVAESQTELHVRSRRGALRVPIPRRTGVYPLELVCSRSGREAERLGSTLYVTHAPPSASLECSGSHTRPLPESWYRAACTWGEGFTAETPQSLIMQALVAVLYRYGESHWRYGYCTVNSEAQCVFPPTSLPRAGLSCFKKMDGSQICRCPWQRLLAQGDPCNFGNCFTFSDVLLFMAKMLGVSGLSQAQTQGAKNLGFTTNLTFRSLDPKFPGNLLCRDKKNCGYLFDIHDVVELDGVLYDLTFGKVYDSFDSLIHQNILQWCGGDINTVLLPNATASFLYDGYGTWHHYETPGLPACRAAPQAGQDRVGGGDLLPLLSEALRGEAVLPPASRIRTEPIRIKGRTTALRIHVPIEVRKPVPLALEARFARAGETLGTGTRCLETFRPGAHDIGVDVPLSLEPAAGRESGDLTLVLFRTGELELLDSLEMRVDLPPRRQGPPPVPSSIPAAGRAFAPVPPP